MICARCLRFPRAVGAFGAAANRPSAGARTATARTFSKSRAILSRQFSIIPLRLPRPASPSSPILSARTLPPSNAVLRPETNPTGITQSRTFSSASPLGAPRNTFNPSHFVRKRRHGFLSRIRTRKGRNTIKRRQLKGRNTVSH